MGKLIFDEEGKTWVEGSLELRRRLHCLWEGEHLTPLLVRNLGYVSLSYGPSSAVVRFRAKVVSEIAIGALLLWLWENQPERILLTSVAENGEEYEIVGSVSAVARRIGQIMVSETETSLFRARRVDPALLKSDESLGALLQLWRASAGRLDWRSHEDLMGGPLNGRFIVLSVEHPNSDLRIEAAGAGLRVPGTNWFADNIGAPLSLMPDCLYRQRVSMGYYATLRTGDPYLEDVEATIFWPGHGSVLRRYRRIILRCPNSRGTNDLLCATRISA